MLPPSRPDLKALVEGAPELAALPERLRGVLAEIVASDEATTPRNILDVAFGAGVTSALIDAGLVMVWALRPVAWLTLTPTAAALIGVEVAEPYWVPVNTLAPTVRMRGERGHAPLPFADMVPDRGLGPLETLIMAEEAKAPRVVEDGHGNAVALWGREVVESSRVKPPKRKAKRRAG